MKTAFDFTGVEPRAPQQYATATPPEVPGLLLWTGSSYFGSHAIRGLLGCARSAALSESWARAPASDESGRVEVLGETEGVVEGPVSIGRQDGQSVYMIRGTFIHVAIAHALILGSIKRGEYPMVAGRNLALIEGAAGPLPWYTPEDAIEAAATLVGTPGFKYALPAARVMSAKAVEWANDLLARERVVAIETQYAWHVPGPWAYTARYDLVTINRASGLLYGYDYKTAVKPADAKLKYAQSAQLMGQDQIGRTGYGQQWGGVKVLLVEDTGFDRPPVYPKEWPIPIHPRTRDIGQGISEATQRFAPYIGKPAALVPPNPLYCSGCAAHIRALCAAT